LYPESSFDELYDNYKQWDDEALAISEIFVYETEEGKEPSEEYIQEGQVLAEKQLVKAGYRIAITLQDMWATNHAAKPVVSE